MLKSILKFLLGNKLAVAIAAGLIAALALFFGGYAWIKNAEISSLQTKNKTLNSKIDELQTNLNLARAHGEISKANLSECNVRIDRQNESFKALALENEKLRDRAQVIKKEIETKYIKIKPPNNGCESKLKFYEEIFKELGK